jgi:F-type H+-transporting ATPase subunit c
MKRIVAVALLAMLAVMVIAPAVFASEAAEGAASDGALNYYAMAVLGCGLGIGLAALGTGIGMGLGIGRACEGVARNPGVSNKIMTTLIVGLALVESLAIYALVVVLIVFFVNPFGV